MSSQDRQHALATADVTWTSLQSERDTQVSWEETFALQET